MKKFEVKGMSCSACSARVEKAVSKLEGVTNCSVNLLTNSMQVDGSVTSFEIVEAVKKAGYKAFEKKEKLDKSQLTDKKENENETKSLIIRLVFSVVILLALMYFSMGYNMWGFPLSQSLSKNPLAIGIIQMLLSASVLVINQRFFIRGFKGLLKGAPNMDTLVALGSAISFVYSVGVLFLMSARVVDGEFEQASKLLHNLYFESSAMILALITIGKMLEAYSKGKTTHALKSLMDLSPKTATILRDGVEVKVEVESVGVGDIFVVRTGESIPVDGVVISGNGSVDQSSLTGESVPVDISVGDKVSATTINKSGFLTCKATHVGKDTAFSKVVQLVNDSVATKAPIARIADKVSGVFVPIVLGIALLTFIVWLLCQATLGFAISKGIAVLVISCPCALGLATPVAIMVGNGVSAKNGILFKSSVALENAGKLKIVVLDKTGTVTEGKAVVTDIIADNKERLLKVAYAIEQKSEHPLSQAIKSYAKENQIELVDVEDFEVLAGSGLRAKLGNSTVIAGSIKFISDKTKLSADILKIIERLSDEGKTPLGFVENGEFIGLIAVADKVKADSKDAINQLKKLGIRVVMLTGDNEKTAKAIASSVGIDEVFSDALPSDKAEIISMLMREGKVAMVGDGINDAPSITRADVGIAIGAGTDVAIDSAEIVLMKNSINDVVATVRISKATLKIIHQNLFWAFIYNIIGIPLAAGVFYPAFGLSLSPMFGAGAMSLSSVCVVSNALRLNVLKPYKNKE